MALFNVIKNILSYDFRYILNYDLLPNPIITGWILEFGVWSDSRRWIDTEFWTD